MCRYRDRCRSRCVDEDIDVDMDRCGYGYRYRYMCTCTYIYTHPARTPILRQLQPEQQEHRAVEVSLRLAILMRWITDDNYGIDMVFRYHNYGNNHRYHWYTYINMSIYIYIYHLHLILVYGIPMIILPITTLEIKISTSMY